MHDRLCHARSGGGADTLRPGHGHGGGRIRQIDTPENLLRRRRTHMCANLSARIFCAVKRRWSGFSGHRRTHEKAPRRPDGRAAALLVFFAVTFAYPLSRMLAQITPEGAAAVFSSTVFLPRRGQLVSQRRVDGAVCAAAGDADGAFDRVDARALQGALARDLRAADAAPLRVAGYGAGTAAGNERPAHAGSPPAGEHLRPAGHPPRTGALHRADRLSAAGEPPALPQPLAV